MALHSYTALLPLVEISKPSPALPGLSTPAAVEAGVFWSVIGGINTIVERLASRERQRPESSENPRLPSLADPPGSPIRVADAPGSPIMVFLAGGDARLLEPCLEMSPMVWPEITLEGIRLAVHGQ